MGTGLKPRPTRMAEARLTKVEGSSSLWRSTASRYCSLSGPSSMSSFSASASRRCSSFCALSITYSSAVKSHGGASRSRKYVSMCSGTGTSRAAMHFSMVDLPQPDMPMRP